jgi:hypothetical protein
MALWLRDDNKATIAFHSLDGPTNHPGRHPKYCVCAGIDESLAETDISVPPGSVTYGSLRDAAKHFASNHKPPLPWMYLWVKDGEAPAVGDRIKPFFDYALAHDLPPGEPAGGTAEDYSAHQSAYPPARWPNNMRTWKLKKWNDP